MCRLDRSQYNILFIEAQNIILILLFALSLVSCGGGNTTGGAGSGVGETESVDTIGETSEELVNESTDIISSSETSSVNRYSGTYHGTLRTTVTFLGTEESTTQDITLIIADDGAIVTSSTADSGGITCTNNVSPAELRGSIIYTQGMGSCLIPGFGECDFHYSGSIILSNTGSTIQGVGNSNGFFDCPVSKANLKYDISIQRI